jgi:hypothetical protein
VVVAFDGEYYFQNKLSLALAFSKDLFFNFEMLDNCYLAICDY